MTNDKIALVTGANKGIGYEIARQLTDLGWTVVAAARDKSRDVALDVTDPASIAAAANEVGATYGRLDVLVNNAGISGGMRSQTPGAVELDAIREVFETNVFGVVAVTEAFLPLLRKANGGARIVNLTSSVGSLTRMSDPSWYFTHIPGSLAYAPSKTALNQVTVQYAKQLAPEGIGVYAADPGPCDTDFTRGKFKVTRTAAEGAEIAVRLATGEDMPSGNYVNAEGPVPW
ncbi:SDR family NAD(P)-dependent oxidoreductase [Tenggerimyces flavus]|uniref:SDR family NAD(P)-dependent oxidoreductase n=1 Tax=Tenggerimyces flavus TaxID=1708749 RepID=A0ABV7Y783_9ACTN|nr:SDR family NAD(P)-dependent oxidoreductase [Tenggerimyces flavus]MBM7785408.1 NAD(P)-dependent dehydrogenase (short-subunit alcohol dehydrogenase family) [Tenggerimyces flavus]